MNSPLVSISCITYNHERFIPQCLDGFLMQQCNFDFEILIHDDASTDNTAAIIREYEAKYPDIIKPIYQTENQWSKGIKSINPTFNYPRVKGKYIALCEGDDYWTDPLKLQKQVDFMDNDKTVVLCAHQADIVDNDGSFIKKYNKPKPKYIKPFEIVLKGGDAFATAGIVFRREMLDSFFFQFLRGFPVGDTVLIYTANEVGKIGFINDTMSAYRINVPGSWTSGQKGKTKHDRLIKVIRYNHKMLFKSKYTFYFLLKQLETIKRLVKHDLFYLLRIKR